MLELIEFVRSSCQRARPALLFLVCACVFSAAASASQSFIVNSPSDVPDAIPGDHVCETVAGNGVCTLRAAIQEANSNFGADTIVLQPNVTYLLTRAGSEDKALNGDLDILDSVTIIGAASVVDGNGAAIGERLFEIYRCIRDQRAQGTNECEFAEVFVTMSGITVQHGGAGGIANEGHLTVENCTVTANTINHVGAFYPWGGGIANTNTGSLSVTGSVVSNNVSADDTHSAGGGIYSAGALTIDSTTISGNVVTGTPGEGGGIYSVGPGKVIIKNSTVSANSSVFGGGIYLGGSGNAAVLNSTVSGNSSDDDGGGIYSRSAAGSVYNATITNNGANIDEFRNATGGGVFVQSSFMLSVANSIIVGNSVLVPTTGKPVHDPDQCSGSINSLGNNLLSDIDLDHCTMAGPYNVASVALGPLQYNGGPTKTHALPSGSAAIDAGNAGGCVDGDAAPIATDQRGVPRPFGSHCDAGAFEASDVIFLNRFEIGI